MKINTQEQNIVDMEEVNGVWVEVKSKIIMDQQEKIINALYFLMPYMFCFYLFLAYLYRRKILDEDFLDPFFIGFTSVHLHLLFILAIVYFS